MGKGKPKIIVVNPTNDNSAGTHERIKLAEEISGILTRYKASSVMDMFIQTYANIAASVCHDSSDIQDFFEYTMDRIDKIFDAHGIKLEINMFPHQKGE